MHSETASARGNNDMPDIQKTLKLVSGALFDRESTWKSYLPDAENWQKTLMQLTLPLIIASAIAAFLMSTVLADNSMFSLFKPTLKSTLIGMLGSLLMAGLVAAIIGSLSGVFGGKTSIALGLAATTLAFIPGYLAQVVAWIPWIGGILSVGLGIFSLVLLWKIIPLYLEVPDGKRAAHYVVSLLATVIVGFLLSMAVMPDDYAKTADSPFADISASAGISQSVLNGVSDSDGSSPSSSANASSTESAGPAGMMSGAASAAEIMRSVAKDRYTPPADGKLTEEQVLAYLSYIAAAGEDYRKKKELIDAVSKDVEKDGDVTMSDISNMMKAANAGGGIAVIEMKAVKAGGGNWAEHQWVRQTLVAAGRMQDANETTAHNYALFQKYDAAIMRGIAPE